MAAKARTDDQVVGFTEWFQDADNDAVGVILAPRALV